MRIESAIFEMVSLVVSRENLSMWKEHLKILSRYYDNTILSSQNFLQSSFLNCIIYFISVYSKLYGKVNWKIWYRVITQQEKKNVYVILFQERNIISFFFFIAKWYFWKFCFTAADFSFNTKRTFVWKILSLNHQNEFRSHWFLRTDYMQGYYKLGRTIVKLSDGLTGSWN